jgi:hypothetical protein
LVAFAFLTPFFFLRGGLNVSLGAVFTNLGRLGILFATKMVPKIGLVLPLARRYGPSMPASRRLWTSGRDHRPDTVLAAGQRGRALGDHPHRDRPALILAGCRSRAGGRRG